MTSGAVNFIVLLCIALVMWLVLKPMFPTLTYTKTFEKTAIGWMLTAVAFWMLVLYGAVGVALCEVIFVVADHFGEGAAIEHFVRSVARHYLGFLPRGIAELWPALAFGAVIAGWNIYTSVREHRRLPPLLEKGHP